MSDYLDEMDKRDKANARRKALCGDAAAPLTTYAAKLEHEVGQVTKEQEQKILDLLHAGNNVGKVAEAVGLEPIVVAQILSRNVKTYGSYLAKTVEE